MTRLVLIAVVFMLASMSELRSAGTHFCAPIYVGTFLSEGQAIEECNDGDAMSLQVSPKVALGQLVAKVCDFRFNIVVERLETKKLEPLFNTVVCIYRPKAKRQ